MSSCSLYLFLFKETKKFHYRSHFLHKFLCRTVITFSLQVLLQDFMLKKTKETFPICLKRNVIQATFFSNNILLRLVVKGILRFLRTRNMDRTNSRSDICTYEV
uniref:Uncharacterized protein n=1 Tax=Cacopsylla melanoneura TaxID=428564 RepID=A0A8D8SZA4_9HEMI